MIFDMCGSEEILGYFFKNKQLLRQAFTHSSYAHETGEASNERLEFLGDGVLKFILTDHLYVTYPTMSEGEMTHARISLECKQYLAGVITKLELYPYILFGGAEKKGEERDRAKEDVFEAVVGAIYLDGGFEAAKGFVTRTILNDLPAPSASAPIPTVRNDGKSLLSEWAQKNRKAVVYELVSRDGPSHKSVFTVAVKIDGEIKGNGKGSTRKEAEQTAATEAIQALGVTAQKQEGASEKPPQAKPTERKPFIGQKPTAPQAKPTERKPFIGQKPTAPQAKPTERKPFIGQKPTAPQAKPTERKPFIGQKPTAPQAKPTERKPFIGQKSQPQEGKPGVAAQTKRQSDEKPTSPKKEQVVMQGLSTLPTSKEKGENPTAGTRKIHPYGGRRSPKS